MKKLKLEFNSKFPIRAIRKARIILMGKILAKFEKHLEKRKADGTINGFNSKVLNDGRDLVFMIDINQEKIDEEMSEWIRKRKRKSLRSLLKASRFDMKMKVVEVK